MEKADSGGIQERQHTLVLKLFYLLSFQSVIKDSCCFPASQSTFPQPPHPLIPPANIQIFNEFINHIRNLKETVPALCRLLELPTLLVCLKRIVFST